MPGGLATQLVVGAIRRSVEAQGGFAMVLARGDADAGDVLLVVTDRMSETADANPLFFQPIPAWRNEHDRLIRWERIGQDIDNKGKASDFLAKKRRIDPDLWIVELNVADRQRFAEELTNRN